MTHKTKKVYTCTGCSFPFWSNFWTDVHPGTLTLTVRAKGFNKLRMERWKAKSALGKHHKL